MEMTPALARRPATSAAAGAALLAVALYLAAAWRAPVPAAIAGAGGLAILRLAFAGCPYSRALVALDAAAFALFAFDRNDGLGFWQLSGPWVDVFRFNLPSAAIALIVYIGASVMALIGGARGLRLIEAVSLIAVPFLFNLLLTVGADWHMAEIGGFVTDHAALPFPAQVAIGRALTLWFIGEAMLILITLVSVNRLPLSARRHVVYALSGAAAAATPLIANAAQLVTQPFLAIFVSSTLRRACPGGPLGNRLSYDRHLPRLARRPPAALRRLGWNHWRTGFVKGAIYGALFMGFILIAALVLRAPGAGAIARALRAASRPVRRRTALSARPDDHRQRRRDAAFLRPSQSRLSRPARARARRRRRPRPRAGL